MSSRRYTGSHPQKSNAGTPPELEFWYYNTRFSLCRLRNKSPTCRVGLSDVYREDGRGRHVDLAFHRCLRGGRLSERGGVHDAAEDATEPAQLALSAVA